ncbi:alpha-L-rhamnosidase C-terminal domain-containing protein [Streptomyces sp. NPDC051572]|uniref:alpha-L-rhamnosidase-related protein n=1 Tax=Streptomyces sp. NPDC051572 TaxID=3155802 RepID=UPI00344D784F
MAADRRTVPRRRRNRILVALAGAAALLLWCLPQAAQAAQAASAAGSAAPWPSAPDWQSSVEAPSGATVCPTAVTSTSGSVSGAANLVCGGSGGATLTLVAGGATPTVVLDYGKDVGGLPYFTVSAESGSPQLKAGYSESSRYLSASGDGGTPWGEGDSARSDTYTVTGPGTITNRSVQGGERYEEITLTSPGTLTLTAAGVQYIADRTTADGYQGYFVSSSDQLNKIWYEGAYTAQLDSAAAGSLPGSWRVGGGVLDAYGSAPPNVGLLNQGGAWGDYTTTFDTNIVSNQAGWAVRGQNADNGYVFILNAHDDTSGTPDTLQELDLHDGTYTGVGSTTLPAPLTPGSWHTVTTTVSGTNITVSLDNTQLVSLSSASFPAGTTAYPTGTVGFREYTGEEAYFRNLKVVNSSGATLYSNALGTTSALSDFAVPGVNSVASILDGAKRDRAIWSGDLNVEGPTVYDSTGRTDYLKGALQLLGSYRLSSGFVTGALPPQSAPHTGAAIQGTTGTYSATYSMYWLLALESYYLYTGDTAFVQQEWPIAQAELAWNATQVDSRGLFVTDGSTGADWDFYDNVKAGAVTEYNLIYYKALLDGAQLATAAGQSTLAAQYTQRAATLKAAINTYLFNSATGLYRISDTKTTGVPQDANALAVLYGVAPAANHASILAALKTALWTTPYGPLPFSSDAGYSPVISPYASGYELQARLATGDTAGAESLLGTLWGHMASAGTDFTGTMWENVATDGSPGLGKSTSLAHGWSTAPTSALSGYVLGAQPVTAGYATWSVQPHPGDLTWAEGKVPTPHGALAVSWAGESGIGQFGMQVTAPSGTSGTIAVPTYGGADPVVSVGGQVVWSDGTFTATGGIGGAHADADYVYLTGVQPGTYLVAANLGGAATPTGYTSCAQENGTCSFTGTRSVAFGANGIYSYQTLTDGTSCTSTALVDPDYGVVKSCYTGPVTTGPAGSTLCATENGMCPFTGTRTVAYGAGSTYKQKALTSGTPCTNAVFTDPLQGTVKACSLLPAD